MDDLYNAVEDVRLMNAMTDAPRPTKEWTLPSAAEIKDYVNNEEALDPLAMDLCGICSNCLGFYLFLRYLRDKGEKVFADFLADAAIYKKTKWHNNRIQQARLIHSAYMSEHSNVHNSQHFKAPEGLFRIHTPSENTEGDKLVVTEENYSRFLASEAENNSSFPIGFCGEPFEDFLAIFNKITSSPPSIQKDELVQLFDKLELIAFYHMKSKHFASFQKSTYFAKYLSFMTLSVQHVTKEDFSLFRVLGRGGFGIVYGCKRCQSGHLYALKVMDKKRIKSRRAENLCITERNLLTMLDSPFIVGLKYAYETPVEVHLVLEIMTGGDLGYHLRRKGIFNKMESKYYICRTILGIKTLHSFNIIFRDLKPDNILMDSRGRTALSDLGLAVVMPRNGITGACGTRGYWAPEMLMRTPEGSRVRYNLKMGEVMLQEAVAAGNKDLTKEQAIDVAVKEHEPHFAPELFSESAIDLITKLLCKNGKTRLGANGPEEVMSHPFFDDVNWEEYEDDSIKPPCLPRKDLNYATQTEIGGFGEEKSGEPIPLSERETYSHWSYTRPTAFLEEVVTFLQHEEEAGPVQIRTDNSICCAIS